jgi:2-aminoadipate transaminase
MEKLFSKRMQNVKPSEIRVLLKLNQYPDVFSYGSGNPNADMFPIEKLSEVFSEVILERGKEALQYSVTEGYLPLREKLVARMNAMGVSCGVENLLIIQGAQQGLDLVAKMFLDEGDSIIVEDPTFAGAIPVFNPYFPEYNCIPVDSHGMQIDELERQLEAHRNVKFIYTVPDFQNPTGVTLSLDRRKKMVELASKYDVMIVEDSPYREIRYEGNTLPTIKSFDKTGHVIYIGSFSKILCPGVRTGWMVSTPELTDKLIQLKMAADTQNSTLNMFAIDRFIEKYDLDEHINSMKGTYKYRRDLLMNAIESELPSCVKYSNPQGGLFIWLTFPEHIDATDLMYNHSLPDARVAYVPGEAFFAKTKKKNYCRISYSAMNEDRIYEGMRRLGKILGDIL